MKRGSRDNNDDDGDCSESDSGNYTKATSDEAAIPYGIVT